MSMSTGWSQSNVPIGIKPNAYSQLAAIASNQLLSAYNAFAPGDFVRIYEQHLGVPASFKSWLKMMGFVHGAATATIGHYEYPWWKDTLYLGSYVSGGGIGQSITYSVNTASEFDLNGVLSIFARPRHVILLSTGERVVVTNVNTSTTPFRVTLVPYDGTVDLGLAIGTGTINQQYPIISSAGLEGGDWPTASQTRFVTYTNNFQKIEEVVAATGLNLTTKMYFSTSTGVPEFSQDPSQGMPIFFMEMDKSVQRHEDWCDGALLFGSTNDNTTNLVANSTGLNRNVPFDGTQGLIPFMQENGYVYPYNAGAFTIDDLDAIINIYDRERVMGIGATQLLVLQGFEAYNAVSRTLFDYTVKNTGAIVMERLSKQYGEGTFQASSSFGAFEYSGYDCVFKKLAALNDPLGAGLSGYPYPNYMLWMPMGFTKDGMTGDRRAKIGYQYKEYNGFARDSQLMKFDGTGYTSPIVNTQNDVITYAYRSEIAFHGATPNGLLLSVPR